MDVDEVAVIAIPVLTSATGEAVVRYPVGRATALQFRWRRKASLRNKRPADSNPARRITLRWS